MLTSLIMGKFYAIFTNVTHFKTNSTGKTQTFSGEIFISWKREFFEFSKKHLKFVFYRFPFLIKSQLNSEIFSKVQFKRMKTGNLNLKPSCHPGHVKSNYHCSGMELCYRLKVSHWGTHPKWPKIKSIAKNGTKKNLDFRLTQIKKQPAKWLAFSHESLNVIKNVGIKD